MNNPAYSSENLKELATFYGKPSHSPWLAKGRGESGNIAVSRDFLMKMNNLDHVKNFYPDNYKLDLSETMKAALSKGGPGSSVAVPSGIGMSAPSPDMAAGNAGISGSGYVTEKLYMLLQLYLQNKGWNPSAELLQCFTDLKDNAMLPSAAYLQVLANRMTLDSQGRLVLRENGKIVLPFEHFANAVMLKHMSGPHGLHLSVDATVRAVIESYTIGRENFGMEKEFIIEVVQSCPSPACRYYKNHVGISPLPFMDQQFPGVNPEFLQHLPHLPPPPPPHGHVPAGGGTVSGPSSAGSNSSATSSSAGGGGEVDLSSKSSHSSHPKVPPQLHLTKQQQSIQSQLSQIAAVAAAAKQQHHQQQQQAAAAQQQQQQLTAALIQQQQSRALAQQSFEKFNNLSALEKQRVLSQLDPKHFDPTTMAVAAAAANLQMQGLMQSQVVAAAQQNTSSAPSTSAMGLTAGSNPNQAVPLQAHHNVHHQLPSPTMIHSSSRHDIMPSSSSATSTSSSSTAHLVEQMVQKSVETLRSSRHDIMPSSSSSATSTSSSSTAHLVEQMVQNSVETLRSNLETLESNKDLLALHNGAWSSTNQDLNLRDNLPVGQDKIVRVFAELMRNMARMKTYIRPSMCKPYGKQSESLQKTLMDTIQIVQTLRNYLPPPHIQVSSWKSESEGTSNLTGGVGGVGGVGMVGVGNPTTGSPMLGAAVSGGMGLGVGGNGNVASMLGNLSANRIENLSN